MKKIVIMLLSNGFSPDPRVLQEAMSLVAHGYKVSIYAWDREGKYPVSELVEGICIQRIKVRSIYGRGNSQVFAFLLVYINLFFRLLFKKCDVFHCHDFDMLPIGFLLAKLKGRKVIYDSHECYVDMLMNVSAGIKNVITNFENFLLQRVDAVITVGEILGAYFTQRGAKKVEIIGNWKSPQTFNFSEQKIREKRKLLGLEGKFIITYIGFLNKDRKIIELIRSVAERDDNCVCMIGGLGTMTEEIKNEISKDQKGKWLGYVQHSEVPLLTCVSDVVYECLNPEIQNSKYCATNKFFEALAAGKPFLALNLGEIGKIIKEEDCGILISSLNTQDINKGIDEIKRNYALLSQNSRNSGFNKYNWGIAENRLFKLYKGTLNNDWSV